MFIQEFPFCEILEIAYTVFENVLRGLLYCRRVNWQKSTDLPAAMSQHYRTNRFLQP